MDELMRKWIRHASLEQLREKLLEYEGVSRAWSDRDRETASRLCRMLRDEIGRREACKMKMA